MWLTCCFEKLAYSFSSNYKCSVASTFAVLCDCVNQAFSLLVVLHAVLSTVICRQPELFSCHWLFYHVLAVVQQLCVAGCRSTNRVLPCSARSVWSLWWPSTATRHGAVWWTEKSRCFYTHVYAQVSCILDVHAWYCRLVTSSFLHCSINCAAHCDKFCYVIHRNHSFLHSAEFLAEPENLAISADFLYFCRILLNSGWWLKLTIEVTKIHWRIQATSAWSTESCLCFRSLTVASLVQDTYRFSLYAEHQWPSTCGRFTWISSQIRKCLRTSLRSGVQ